MLWPGAPWVPWSALSILTCLFVVHSYYIELLHQRSDRFDVVGVRLPLPPDSTFTVGADNSADIRLEVPSDSLTHWNLKLRKVADGFSIVDAYGVDAIQQAERRSWSQRFVDKLKNGSNTEWPHKIGAAVQKGSPPILKLKRFTLALSTAVPTLTNFCGLRKMVSWLPRKALVGLRSWDFNLTVGTTRSTFVTSALRKFSGSRQI